MIVGTHAIFQSPVQFKRLGLVIIDEQHRFGVNQRLALRLKGSNDTEGVPHQLMMSATPIPRTLSMSYFADLDVSVINQLPPGRSPVATKLIDSSRRDEVLARVREACHAGRQAYWVCPLIEESEVLQLKTAMQTLATLRETLPELEVALIHGRLDSTEKSAIMTDFSQGTIQLLVATTVIEVGVDVPNASLMVIEHAERMGLSQLHQLRGRIGRGTDAGVCILLFQRPLSELARKRLQVIYKYTDGFEIARQDLLLRGPGEFLGTRQSGVPLLRFADLEADGGLLDIARETADILLRDYPQAAQTHLDRWLGEKGLFTSVSGSRLSQTAMAYQHMREITKVSRQSFSKIDGSMLTAGTADCDCQINTIITHVYRQPGIEKMTNIDHHFRNLRLCLQKTNNFGRLTSQIPQAGIIMRIGNTAHIKHQIGIEWNTVLKAK